MVVLKNFKLGSLSKEIKHVVALSAYIDLIQTAEYALPQGKEKNTNPLDRDIWSKVQLGGIYYLGNDDIPRKILINLK